MRSSPLLVALTLLCSACAIWQDDEPARRSEVVATSSVPARPATAASEAAASEAAVSEAPAPTPDGQEAIAPSMVSSSGDDPERFVCVDGLRLLVSYSSDRQVARVSTGSASLISLRRVPQVGYLAYEAGAARFMRDGPRAVFVSEPNSITVRSGDTLNAIARGLYGESSRARDIVSANPDTLANPNLIHIGQVLRLPHWRHLCRRTLT